MYPLNFYGRIAFVDRPWPLLTKIVGVMCTSLWGRMVSAPDQQLKGCVSRPIQLAIVCTYQTLDGSNVYDSRYVQRIVVICSSLTITFDIHKHKAISNQKLRHTSVTSSFNYIWFNISRKNIGWNKFSTPLKHSQVVLSQR